jgi:hypothetical protein
VASKSPLSSNKLTNHSCAAVKNIVADPEAGDAPSSEFPRAAVEVGIAKAELFMLLWKNGSRELEEQKEWDRGKKMPLAHLIGSWKRISKRESGENEFMLRASSHRAEQLFSHSVFSVIE